MRICLLATLTLLLVMTAAVKAEVKKEILVTNMKNPSGLAIQPETGHVFISDSGNHRVLRYKPTESRENRIEVSINGFPNDVYGKGPMYDIGPLGLGFINQGTLVVGGGGLKDGEELLRIYTTPEVGKKIKADEMAEKLGPIAAGEQSEKGEGNFYGIAVTPSAIYVTCNGDDTKGWVSKAEVADGKASNFAPFIATKTKVEVDAPVGITVDKDGKLVIGQMGEMNKPKDSLLTAYNAESGELEWSAETGLFDIAAVAYNPKDDKLYAVDFAWMQESEGGLYRLDVAKDGDKVTVTAEKIVELNKPSAMAFDKDGNLYITEFGTAEEGSDKGPGQMVRVSGL